MNVRQILRSLNPQEVRFCFFVMMASFFVAMEYSITRPASHSLFLGVFSASMMPWAWLAMIPLNFTSVYLYQRCLPRFGPLRAMQFLALLIVVTNTLCCVIFSFFPKIIFFHFCWKDLYILFMYQQIWSMIHSTISPTRAQMLYAILFGSGTVGSILGSTVPALIASKIGSQQLLMATGFLYIPVLWAYCKAYPLSGAQNVKEVPCKSSHAGFELIIQNRYLQALLCFVICMHISVTLMEYQFSHHLEVMFPHRDIRTQYAGQVYSSVHIASLGFQWFGAMWLLNKIGLRRSALCIPFFLMSGAMGQLAFPGLLMASLAFGMNKSIDFSFFGVVREMLCIPLRIEEKFFAKSVIDVFAPRTAKALASLVLLLFYNILGMDDLGWINCVALALCAWWAFVVVKLFQYQPTSLPVAQPLVEEKPVSELLEKAIIHNKKQTPATTTEESNSH